MSSSPEKTYLEVLGLCCASEVPLVEKILRALEGVNDISVIIPTKTVIVLHDPLIVSQSKLVEALNRVRLEASIRHQGNIDSATKWPSPALIVCGLLFGLSFLKYVYQPLKWLALAAVVIGLPPIALRSLASIKNLTLNINVLVLISVVGTLALQDYWEAASIVFLFSIAQWLELRASHKAMATMSSLASMTPGKAVIAETGESVDVNDVQMSTVLSVKAGEAIPIDGIVVDGKCDADEKMLTGESYPVAKDIGSNVWAGSINLNGYISMRTTALAKDCVVARMAKLVEDAQKKKSHTQGLIDNCAKYYIPGVALVSACIAAVPAALKLQNEDYWFHLAIVVLVGSCPCALILSTPITFFCALSRAAKDGLLFKGGSYLEILAKVKTVAFDKTGTVTRGEFVVTNFQSICNDIDLNTLLYWVSSIESKSSHPMSAAIIYYAHSLSIEPKPEDVEDFQNFPGEGIYGRINGQGIYIGNWRIGLRAGHNTASGNETDTNGFIYTGKSPVGKFSLSDACRTGSMEAIEDIKSLGIKTAMLTGDSQAAARSAQYQLDHALDLVYAELLPENKARIIEDFKKDGPTAMIGDGVNDAPALAAANVGISMGISGSALAMETGHVILMSNDIRKIPEAIKLARRTFRKLVENVLISISLKGAILGLAFAGYPLVWAAVLTDVGTCLIVILNSMQLLNVTSNQGKKFSRSKYGTFSPNTCKKDEVGCAIQRRNNDNKQCSSCCSVTADQDSTSSLNALRDACSEPKFSSWKEDLLINLEGFTCKPTTQSAGNLSSFGEIESITDQPKNFPSSSDNCPSVSFFKSVSECNSSCCLPVKYIERRSQCASGCCPPSPEVHRDEMKLNLGSDASCLFSNALDAGNAESVAQSVLGNFKEGQIIEHPEQVRMKSCVEAEAIEITLGKSSTGGCCKQSGKKCSCRLEQYDAGSGSSMPRIVIE
ncbi:cadmium/zinc-transporting ATPase HMA3-like isoform X2 [Rhodamnia argentea]|uniref:Cadmium/zinc-transporting ATPase HMA3-like isoform X2 n=1 Tax=Rhodamnia argentea TaxID=178133 RepID=A0A8B8QZU3_9MYRT|nr:cadmium/zinc-transporting ATPase HMA3-like isoform X2 [Rhodamnia argentea]